ncbi:MAG: SDR family oxidoreductase [Actinobacteria bacterium]|nr:SDR family oxidoreductase [Actinomycetota bacterium]
MWALVTGATSGIGAEFTKLLAKDHYNIILVARDEIRLKKSAQELEKEFGVTTEIIVADLSVENEIVLVEKRLLTTNPSLAVDVLINNAGYGLKGRFIDHTSAAEVDLLNVLVTAILRLTHAALPNMRNAKSGYIINVGSVAGWLTGSTYSAAKAWVNVFSEYLNADLAKDGIIVTSLAPGFTHTEFHQRGGMKMGAVPEFLWEKATEVAKAGWEGARRGDSVVISGNQYRVIVFLARHLPRKLVRRIQTHKKFT